MSRLEVIYIDESGNARETNLAMALPTPRETWAYFLSLKQFDIGPQECDFFIEYSNRKGDFFIEYYNRKGDFSDSVCVSRAIIERITRTRTKTDAEYVWIDRWRWVERQTGSRCAEAAAA